MMGENGLVRKLLGVAAIEMEATAVATDADGLGHILNGCASFEPVPNAPG